MLIDKREIFAVNLFARRTDLHAGTSKWRMAMSRKPTPKAARDDLDSFLTASDDGGVVHEIAPRQIRAVRAAPDLEKNAIDKHGRLRWRRLLTGLRNQSSRRSA
jgi:hypothetical protein